MRTPNTVASDLRALAEWFDDPNGPTQGAIWAVVDNEEYRPAYLLARIAEALERRAAALATPTTANGPTAHPSAPQPAEP